MRPTDGERDRNVDDWFREAVRGLSLREQTVMYLYYVCGVKMKTVGELLNLSESRVSQMHAHLIAQLRANGRGPELQDLLAG
jgi:RNA polymerase sigma factor for flagellar operon FliA